MSDFIVPVVSSTPGRVTLAPGEVTFGTPSTSGASVRSCSDASAAVGLLLSFDVLSVSSPPLYVSLHPANLTPNDAGVEGALMWMKVVSGGTTYMQPESTGAPMSAYQVVAAGTRFVIWIRPDGVVEYHAGQIGVAPTPVYTSGKRLAPGQLYRFTAAEGVGITSKVKNLRWIRQGPEFRYFPQMQRADYGLADADPLPASLNVRVYQHSRYTGGTRSAPAPATFMR